MRNACRIVVGKPEGKTLLGRRSRRWDDNIKMGNKFGGCGFDSPDSGWEPMALSCEHVNELQFSIKGEDLLYQLSVLLAS
jgi:hypothetical protein